jgi:hypothetical protein
LHRNVLEASLRMLVAVSMQCSAFLRNPLESWYVGAVSAHSYNTVLSGEPLVAVGGRANDPP